tara:strand:- start:81 stop:371 length:291 start_codon:yes stop_codon:yes gene_type:complete
MTSPNVDWTGLKAVEHLNQDTYERFIEPCYKLFTGSVDLELAISVFRDVYHLSEEGDGTPSGISSHNFLIIKASDILQPSETMRFKYDQINSIRLK